MRLDKFLKKTGLVKRRTIAQEMVDTGRVFRDGRPLKNSYQVKEGDEIEIVYLNRILKFKVESSNEREPVYSVICEVKLEREF
ncbi:MAG TPA: RNA-binding S4 domain-containing protein [Thermotogaceae bacterium]|nr:RNA-binding S4 domain-containing protein [Thermotogaceae bacterium]